MLLFVGEKLLNSFSKWLRCAVCASGKESRDGHLTENAGKFSEGI